MERIGRYEIVGELGRGSMSIVYEAFDSRIDRHLAIKVLRGRYARDVTARQRFLREARAAGGLAHPNIITVFDVGQSDGLPYLVMELLPGGTLADWLANNPNTALETARLLDLAGQLASALTYAHQHGVIHRDIKPANIHYEAEAGRIKVMDFGIAAIDRGNQPSDTHQLVGTPTHMAPELLLDAPADERSDLYSLGIVLYQLLSGRLPFTANNFEDLAQQIVSHSTEPLAPIRSDTPRELSDLVYRLMALEPQSRPASARQVQEELEEIQSGLKRGILLMVRNKSAAWRWPLTIGAGVALVLTLGLFQIYTSQQNAMSAATFGYGDALASLVAQETAEALILDDTNALSVLVSDFSVNPQIRYLHITDVPGVVQASTNPYLKGETTPVLKGVAIERQGGNVLVRNSDSELLEFRVPIRFQARRVGEVRLGLDAGTLDATATTTLRMLAVVFSVSLLAVVVGLGWLTQRQHRALKRLAWGLRRLYRGQSDFRLDDERRDEFAHVFQQFNRLAAHLDHQARGVSRPGAENDHNTEHQSAITIAGRANQPVEQTLDLS
ncbi:MAG: protein kinase, partial [Xanthomonadaceae bacterium]|nr:protein kinase [Xanthomonadaceae bacterium]